jgi:hypothetical protein
MNPKSNHAFGFDRHSIHGSNSLVRSCGLLEVEEGFATDCDLGNDWILWVGPLNRLIGAGDCLRSDLFPYCGIDCTDSEGVDNQ